MPALPPAISTLLIVCAILFGAIDVLVYLHQWSVTRGVRRTIAGLVLFISAYALVVYMLSFVGLLPDGAELLSFLLRPVVVGLLGFLAAYGILDRRH